MILGPILPLHGFLLLNSGGFHDEHRVLVPICLLGTITTVLFKGPVFSLINFE